jgi:hypothetical protein
MSCLRELRQRLEQLCDHNRPVEGTREQGTLRLSQWNGQREPRQRKVGNELIIAPFLPGFMDKSAWESGVPVH